MVNDPQVMLSAQLDALGELPVALAWLDRELRFQRVNRAFAELTGLSPDAHAGRAFNEVNPAADAEVLAGLRKVLERGEPLVREGVGCAPDQPGSVRHLRCRASPLRLAGEPAGVLLMVEDQTEARRLELQQARAAAELEAQRARLHQVLEHAPLPLAVLDAADLRYVLATPRFRALFGHRPLVGRTAWELHPELADQGLLQIFQRVAQSGERFVATEMLARLDRGEGELSEGFFNLVVEPLRDGQGKAEAVVVFALELTEVVGARRRAQRLSTELQRMELLFQTVLQTHHSLTWTADFDGELQPSPSLEQFTGLPQGAQRRGGWLEVVHAQDREGVSRAWREAVRTHAPFACEARVRHRDGSFRLLALRASLVRHADGSPREWIGTGADVSAARGADRLLAQLDRAGAELGASLEMDAVLDTLARVAVPYWGEVALLDLADRGELRASRRAQLHGLEVALRRAQGPALGGEGAWQALRSGAAQVLRQEQLEALRDGAGPPPGAAVSVPLQLRGRTLAVLTLARPERGQLGADELRGMAELARRGALALEHARLFSEARAAVRAKDEFLAAVSHELRTPLTSILGWARLLRLRPPSAQQLDHALTVIERNARAQARLVEDLLDVTRAANGRLRIQPRVLDPGEALRAAAAGARPGAEARGVQLEISCAPNLPAVQADPERLQQVLCNLLANSVKETPSDGRVVARVDRGGAGVRITVEDQGGGTPPDLLAGLFERFDPEHSSPEPGALGLGLNLVRRIVELHGGTVNAEAADAGGTRFVLELPALPLAAPAPANDAPALSLARADGVSVLLVDDHADSREALSALLSARGAQVRVAGSAEEALRAVAERAPDVLVSDLAMPGADGFELLRRLKAHGHAALPALALTAHAGPEVDTRAREAGYARCLAKPPDCDALVEAVSSLAGRELS